MAFRVNGTVISDQAINVETAYHSAPSLDERRRQATRALAVRELLLQEARRLDIPGADAGDDPAAVDAALDALLEREVALPEIEEAACRRYFLANRDRFRTPVWCAVRHILLAAAPDDPEARDRAEALGRDLIVQLQDDPAHFAELAEAHSICPSKAQGGSLGWIGKGQTVPELEDVLLRLPTGLVTRPLESRYGYHVVWVDETAGGEPLEYDAVRGALAQYLERQAWQRAVHQYIQLLAGRHEVTGVDLSVASTPLVQ